MSETPESDFPTKVEVSRDLEKTGEDPGPPRLFSSLLHEAAFVFVGVILSRLTSWVYLIDLG
jgi:hypothetical protein